MRPKTSGNTCAKPISPTACSKTTPQSSTLVSSHGVAFSTNSDASHPSPAAIGPPRVNQFEVWYYLVGCSTHEEAEAKIKDLYPSEPNIKLYVSPLRVGDTKDLKLARNEVREWQ